MDFVKYNIGNRVKTMASTYAGGETGTIINTDYCDFEKKTLYAVDFDSFVWCSARRWYSENELELVN
jgi:hypothetical protein